MGVEPERQTVVVTIAGDQDNGMRYSWAELDLLPAELAFFNWLIREIEAVHLPDGAVMEHILNEDEPDEVRVPEDLPPNPVGRLPGRRQPLLLRIGIGGGTDTLMTLRLSNAELGRVAVLCDYPWKPSFLVSDASSGAVGASA